MHLIWYAPLPFAPQRRRLQQGIQLKNPLDRSNGLDIFLIYNNTFLARLRARAEMMMYLNDFHDGVKLEFIFISQKFIRI